jgi:hypothetical protein
MICLHQDVRNFKIQHSWLADATNHVGYFTPNPMESISNAPILDGFQHCGAVPSAYQQR